MDLSDLLALLLGPSGVVVLLLVIVFAGFKGWWVYGRTLKDCTEREDEWKQLALTATVLAEHKESPDA